MVEQAFRTLGLAPGASRDEVRAAYRRLAKRNHPDKFGYDPRLQAQATARMKAINAAYRTLKPYLDGTPPPAPAPPRPPPRRPPPAWRPPPRRTARPAPAVSNAPWAWRAVGVFFLMLFAWNRLHDNPRTTAAPSWQDEMRKIEERNRREGQEELDELVRELQDPRLTPEDVQKKLDEFLKRKVERVRAERPK